MHNSEGTDLPAALELERPPTYVTVVCRPAINVDGYYATLTLTVAGELAAVCDVLTYGERLDPIRAEALVWRVREALTAPQDYVSDCQSSNGGGA